VVQIPDLTETLGYAEYKYAKKTKAADYSYAIRQALTSQYFAPGYIFVPEAFATLVSDNDTYTAADATLDRIKVASAINTVARGMIGDTQIDQATQFVGLIDCGGDITTITQATEELNALKSVVGAPFGHLAYYAPHILNEEEVYVPASAYVAGIACSRNVNEGFQQPPAGVRYPLRGAIGLKFSINAQQQEVTYALGLNAIRSLPNKGIVVWGARTLSSNPLFKFINTRVILNVLIDSLSRSFDDILFEQVDSSGTLYTRVVGIATTLLNQFYRQGALFGNRPEQAYAIICNDTNNTPELLEQGTVRCDIYVATSPTLERIIISIARTPAGQVSIINDAFSRNIDRFQSALQAQNLVV
jgi:phage tail sheath protein FI